MPHEVAVAATLVAVEQLDLLPGQQGGEASRLHVHHTDTTLIFERLASERIEQEVRLLVLLALDHAGVVGPGLLPGEFRVVVLIEVAGLHEGLDRLGHATNLAGA
ncbi:hypothetical protein D9M69_656510 [compost metagenome]